MIPFSSCWKVQDRYTTFSDSLGFTIHAVQNMVSRAGLGATSYLPLAPQYRICWYSDNADNALPIS